MGKINFADIQMLLAIENPMVRKGLRDGLYTVGISKVVDVIHKDNFHDTLRDNNFDLIIMTPELEGHFIANFITQMRNGQLGRHPFAMTMILLPVADREILGKIIDCGPDDLLLMPVAPNQVVARVEAMTQQRKPFIVTQDYTGPDRRKEKRPGTEEIPLLEVPNPLQAKVSGMAPEVLDAKLTEGASRLNAAKLGRYIVQMNWLDRSIRNLLAADQVDEMTLRKHAMRLMQVAEDVPVRLPDPSGTLEKLAGAVAACGNSLFSDGDEARRKTLQGLSVHCARLARDINSRITAPPVAAG